MIWQWLTSLLYPQTLRRAKLLTLNMFSEVPRGQIERVINFALWFDIHWYDLALFLHAVCWIEMLRLLKWEVEWSEYRCSHSSHV